MSCSRCRRGVRCVCRSRPRGLADLIGPQGVAGLVGAIGEDGVQGLVGAIGPAGVAGLVGGIGPQGIAGLIGAIGLQGVAGLVGGVGPAGVSGLVGAVGPQGVAGLVGEIGVQGLAGIVGEQGIAGIAGEIGLTGPQGAQGPQGASAEVLGYAMFYGLTAGTGNPSATDYAATVAVKTAPGTGRVPFPRDSSTSGDEIVRDDASSFRLVAAGTYRVSFKVHATEPGQLQLEVDGAGLPETTTPEMNPTAGGHLFVADVLVTVAANAVLAVINPVGNSTPLTITPADGASTHANAQSIAIERVA